MNLLFDAKTLSELGTLLDDNDAEDVFVYKASYGGIDDPEMHRLKNQYIAVSYTHLTLPTTPYV